MSEGASPLLVTLGIHRASAVRHSHTCLLRSSGLFLLHVLISHTFIKRSGVRRSAGCWKVNGAREVGQSPVTAEAAGVNNGTQRGPSVLSEEEERIAALVRRQTPSLAVTADGSCGFLQRILCFSDFRLQFQNTPCYLKDCYTV